jgi:L-fuconate dehydratase
VSINEQGRYRVPLEENCGYSIEMFDSSIREFTFPTGSYWVAAAAGNAPKPDHLGLAKH